MSHFGKNIKRIREERQMTLQELAVKARIGTNSLMKYEEGKRSRHSHCPEIFNGPGCPCFYTPGRQDPCFLKHFSTQGIDP
ncbi:helix-turn-helix domain-containing protein [Rossellomorea sp. H39__3]